ncbi:aflF [Aspergillus flavus]|uniref:AflF n=1 Tax=Aspergillus flavus (strain ATCC 200026 / FGSC A1120 / IAM 13836 / NRRL 3357 / JCM 12722 / SRRC 167) TaxID=332952 RepID=A0A7U2MNK6_ASPFN|nr:aflF [Aspergillus flavus]
MGPRGDRGDWLIVRVVCRYCKWRWRMWCRKPHMCFPLLEPAVHISLMDEEVNTIENAYEFDPGFPHTFLSGSMFAEGPPKGGYSPDVVWWTKMLGTFDWVEGAKPIRPHP